MLRPREEYNVFLQQHGVDVHLFNEILAEIS